MEPFIIELKQLLIRESNSHKGDFGHVLIIGGDYGMGGAVIMAAEAAYRVGAGKVTLLTRKENFAPLLARLPNAMTVADETLTEDVLANKDVIVIGCGLGKSKWARDLLKIVLSSNLPKVIDADALNIISDAKKSTNLKNAVITPHVGEASRLLKISTAEIEKDRERAVKKLHEKYGAVAVLKGSGTLVFGKELITCSESFLTHILPCFGLFLARIFQNISRYLSKFWQKNAQNIIKSEIKKDSEQVLGIYRCQYGNSGMATAGMGDVLSGIIGGLMAQHLDNIHSATYGVNIHAFAGDLAAKKQGEIGMMPQDLFQYIPQVINNNYG